VKVLFPFEQLPKQINPRLSQSLKHFYH